MAIGTVEIQVIPNATGIEGKIQNQISQAISNGSQGYGKSLAGALGTAAKIGTVAIAGATTAIGAFGVASVKTGSEFDASMSQVAATMGKTMSEMANETGRVDLAWGTFSGNLRDYAREMGRQTQFSATEAADALNYMALAGYDTQTSMSMLPNVLNLAAAGGMELARASDMVTDTQTAFGLSLERTSLMVDEMAKAASTGNTNIEQLGDAFLVVGGLAQELNGGFIDLGNGADQFVDGTQEMEIALTAMANAGIKGSEAGTHMRNMLLKLSSPTSDGAKQMEALGVSVFDTEGRMRSLNDIFGDLNVALGNLTQEQKIQAISDLFNSRDIASSEALLNAVSSDWDKIGASILDAKVSLEDVQGAIEKTSVDFSKYTGDASINVKDLAADIRYDLTTAGMTTQEAARDIAEAFDMNFLDATKAVNAVSDALREADGAANEMRETMNDNLAGDIKELKSAFSDMQIELSDQLTPSLREFADFGTEGLQKMTGAFKTGGISGAMAEFGTLLSEGLSMVVAKLPEMVNAGVQLLSALVQGIVQNAPMILSAFVEIGSIVSAAILDLMNHAAEGLGTFDWSGAATQLATTLTNALTGEGAQQFITTGTQIVTNLASGLGQALPILFPAVINIATSLLQMIMQQAPTLMQAGMQLVVQLGQGLIQAIPTLIANLPPLITSMVNTIATGSPMMMQAGMQLFLGLVQALPEIVNQLIAALPELITALVTGLVSYQAAFITAGIQLFVGLVEALPQVAAQLLAALPQIVPAIVQGLLAASPAIFAAGVQLFMVLVQAIPQLISALISSVPQITTIIVTLLTRGIPLVLATAKNLFHTIVEAIPEVVSQIGAAMPDVINGIVQGLRNGVGQVYAAARELGGKIVSGIKDMLGINSPSTVMAEQGNYVVEGLMQGITNNSGGVATALTPIVSSFSTWGTQLAATMTTNGTTALTSFVNAINVLPERLTEVWNNSLNTITTFITAFAEKAKLAAENFKTGIMTGMSKIPDLLKSIADKMINVFKSLPDKFRKIGGDIIEGLANGITGAWGALQSKVASLASSLASTVKSALQIGSPSRVFADEVGVWIPAGIAAGIEEGMSVVDDAMNAMSTNMVSKAGTIAQNATYNMNYEPAETEAVDIKALYDLMMTYLPVIASKQDVTVELEADTSMLFRAMKREEARNAQLVGT